MADIKINLLDRVARNGTHSDRHRSDHRRSSKSSTRSKKRTAIAAQVMVELDQGTSVAVSPAGKLRLRYNEGTGNLELSVNGTAYIAVVTL